MVNLKLQLENESFSLIQTETSHFEKLYSVAGNPIIWEQHPENDRWKREVFIKFFQIAMENTLGCFTIVDKTLDKFIGSTRFYSYDKIDNSIRLGYTFLSNEYWGTSVNLQIKKLMLDYAFRHIDKVYFDIGEENFRSRKATEKLGAVMHKKNSNGKLIYLLFKQDYVL
jgi:RimJ/RimL family protein N-acetyltransferase